MTDDLAASRLGRVVGKYRLERVVGTGGMATVYEATHRNGNRVALKMLKPSLAVADEIRTRFLREGYAANKVGHPGAVRILDDDVTSDGLVFLVMELLEGWTLEVLAREHGGTLAARVVFQVATQLLDVLAAAHAAGIVHRDIKPENVFVQRDGVVKVLDFGVARVREPKSAAVTATGRMLGTPAFMPPEQAYGRRAEVDARSDLWSVGATIFTALSGRVVHVASTSEETLIKAATEPAPPLASVVADCPPSLAAVVDRALLSEKTARWSSATEMRDAALRAYEAAFGEPCPSAVAIALDDRAPDATATPRATRRSRAAWWAGAALAASAAVLVGGAVSARSRAPSDVAHAASPATAMSVSASLAADAPVEAPAAPVEKNDAPSMPSVAAPSTAAVVAAKPATRTPARAARVFAPTAAPSSSSLRAAPTPTASASVCGFEFDEEGRKWPRRCP